MIDTSPPLSSKGDRSKGTNKLNEHGNLKGRRFDNTGRYNKCEFERTGTMNPFKGYTTSWW